jgi:hypothetical protein
MKLLNAGDLVPWVHTKLPVVRVLSVQLKQLHQDPNSDIVHEAGAQVPVSACNRQHMIQRAQSTHVHPRAMVLHLHKRMLLVMVGVQDK